MRTADEAWVDLYWLPLGAGGHSVRFNGKVYEWLASRREHRRPCDIYHSALVVHLDGVDWTVEMGPVWNVDAPTDAAACTGAVGAPWLGRFRAFATRSVAGPAGAFPTLTKPSAAHIGSLPTGGRPARCLLRCDRFLHSPGGETHKAPAICG